MATVDTWGEVTWGLSSLGSTVYSAFAHLILPSGRIIAVGFRGTAFYSDDNGSTWVPTAGERDPNYSAYCIARDPDNGRVFYGMDLYGETTVIYYSDDDGDTWTGVDAGTLSFLVRQIVITPTGRIIAVGRGFTESMVYSDNGGTSFSVLRDDGNRYESAVLMDNGSILAGGWEGVFISSDNGDTWTPVSYFSGLRAFSMIHLTSPALTVVSTFGDNGAQRLNVSSDYGATWSELTPPGSGFGPLSRLGADTFVWAEDETILWVTEDRGSTWAKIYDSSVTHPDTSEIIPLIPRGNYYLSQFAVYLSTGRVIASTRTGNEAAGYVLISSPVGGAVAPPPPWWTGYEGVTEIRRA